MRQKLNYSNRKAFTLAEILIVLVLIGVLTAILLPVAFHAAPDEDVMKFKKANNTLATVIRELVTSDKYYKDGDLGIRANGELIDGSHDGDITYFCNSFADVIATKKVNCSQSNNGIGWIDLNADKDDYQSILDTRCKIYAETIGDEIAAVDNVIYFQTAPMITFGIETTKARTLRANNPEYREDTPDTNRNFGGYHTDENGFDRIYKIFCMDIDGINKGEDPFGYGIRADGKILPGARANEYIQKSIQKGSN